MPKPEFPGGIIKLLLDHDGEMMKHHENQEKRIASKDGTIETMEAWNDKQNDTIDQFCDWFKLNGNGRCESCPLWQQGDDLKWRCGR